jgi:hypothetical protein
MKTKLILFLLSYLISSNLFASCHTNSLGKTITVTGWTPEEAYEKLHLELPKLGVLQRVDVKNLKAMSDNTYHEQTILTRTITANIDSIATYHCKINNMYAITASIPNGAVDYYPEYLKDMLNNGIKPEGLFLDYWSFENAKKYCGGQDYSWIVTWYNHVLDIKGSEIRKSFRDGPYTVNLVCGTGWEMYLYSSAGMKYYDRAQHYYKHKGRKYTARFYNQLHFIGDFSDNMDLQMLQNAMK